MRWVLAAFVVAWSAVASAQTMTIPAGFKKTDGGDVYKTLAAKGDTIAVQMYREGSYVELATIAWEWKAETPTRSALERFEHALARKSISDRASVVSSSALFDRDPIEVSIFEALGTQRIYHRRLYAVDANQMVHVWWTICTAPSTLLYECGRAQRTMKLDVPDAITLPADPKIAAPVPSTLPVIPEPWHIVLSAEYGESDADIAALRGSIVKAATAVEESQVRMFVSRGPVRLLLIMLRMPAGDDAPDAAIADMDAGMSDRLRRDLDLDFGLGGEASVGTNERSTLPIWGDSILSRESFSDYERRGLYSVDARGDIYAFNAVCIGQRFERDDCEKVLESMRLVVPDQISGESSAWQRRPHQLRNTLLAIVAGLAAVSWIVVKRYRRRRRPIEPPIAIDPS